MSVTLDNENGSNNDDKISSEMGISSRVGLNLIPLSFCSSTGVLDRETSR